MYGVKVVCVLPGFFATALSDPVVYENQVRGNWASLPQEVRDHYGEDYIDTSESIDTSTQP